MLALCAASFAVGMLAGAAVLALSAFHLIRRLILGG